MKDINRVTIDLIADMGLEEWVCDLDPEHNADVTSMIETLGEIAGIVKMAKTLTDEN